jgi:hypothetical protein
LPLRGFARAFGAVENEEFAGVGRHALGHVWKAMVARS